MLHDTTLTLTFVPSLQLQECLTPKHLLLWPLIISRCELEISNLGINWEFLSRGVWGPTMKAPNEIWGKAQKYFAI